MRRPRRLTLASMSARRRASAQASAGPLIKTTRSLDTARAWGPTTEFASLLRTHVPPPLTELLAALRRKASEPLARSPEVLAFFRRQSAELLEAFPETPAIFIGQPTPALQPFARFGPRFRRHAGPPPGAVAQSFLSLERELLPCVAERLEDLLFLRAELTPGHTGRLGLRPRRRRPHGQQNHSRYEGLTHDHAFPAGVGEDPPCCPTPGLVPGGIDQTDLHP